MRESRFLEKIAIPLVLALTGLMAVNAVWATEITYRFTGTLDPAASDWITCEPGSGGLADEEFCGPFSGTIVIDTEQTGWPDGSGIGHYYSRGDVTITFNDGYQMISTYPYNYDERIFVWSTDDEQMVQTVVDDDVGEGWAVLTLYFPSETFDITNFAEVLSAVADASYAEPDPHLLNVHNIPDPSGGGLPRCWIMEGGLCVGAFGELSSAPVIDATATIAPDAVIGNGSTIGAYTVIEKGVSIGLNSTIGSNVTINKNTQLGDNSVIGDYSTIQKDVVAGDNLTVGVNVTIFKDVVIGSDVTIGDNSEIHAKTVIGDDVTIGIIGGGYGVHVGNRVTIASGTTIDDGEVIKNNATVP